MLFQPIENAYIFLVLNYAELLELTQGVLVSLGFGDASGAVEDLAVVEAKESVQVFDPSPPWSWESACGRGTQPGRGRR